MSGRGTTRANVHRVEGWLVSFILHGFLLSAALPLFRHVPIIIPTQPFRWDINLVQSPQVHPDQRTEARTPEQPVANDIAPAAIPAEVHDRSRPPASFAKSHKRASPIHESAAATEPPVQNAFTTAAMEPTSVITESPPSRNVTAEQVSSPSAIEHTTVPTAPTSEPPPPENESTASPATPERPVEAPVGTDTGIPSGRGSDSAASRPFETRTAAEVVPSSATRTDYSWLQRTIFQRLEELKRSSRPSLDDSRPLKVLVRAVVSNEGILMETEVMKSSGLDRIDKEAMALVQRAFPIQLDRALDRQRIVMRIPITYSRD